MNRKRVISPNPRGCTQAFLPPAFSPVSSVLLKENMKFLVHFRVKTPFSLEISVEYCGRRVSLETALLDLVE